MARYLDTASGLTIGLTLLFFGIALFTTGLTHDLLLEAGVFLVSAKLVLAGYKNDRSNAALQTRLARIEEAIGRLEQSLHPATRPPGA